MSTHHELSARRRSHRRRVVGAAAVGIVLTMSPVITAGSAVEAQAPSVAVTGLTRGDRGDAVRSLQQALVNQGLDVAGGVDGIFGPGTEAALRSFQADRGLVESGTVDAGTAIALGLASSDLLGLTQGLRGPAVVDLQRRLASAGFAPAGGADGIFGPATSTALKAFQTARSLPPTGRVDAATAGELSTVSSGGSDAAEVDQGAERDPQGSAPLNLVGLEIGSRGEAVRVLQATVMNAGFTVVGGADGVFGVLTASALKSFQNANGIEPSGIVDEATAAVLAIVGTGDDTEHDPTVTSPLVGLRRGTIGSDVAALQQALVDAGVDLVGGADGVFGPATENAVKRFQTDNGLDGSGVVDEATAAALGSAGATSVDRTLIGLAAGSLGKTVQQLQRALMDAGIDLRGGADGIFGPATAGALKQFQEAHGLTATGVVDEATAAALADPAPQGVVDPGDGTGFAEYGEKGQRVIALQTALVEAGISLRGGVDGVFGGATSAAVMEFQRRSDLAVTGAVDAATAAALGLDALPAPTAPDPVTVQLEVFPVQGPCGFADSWHAARGGGRKHLGVDVIAAEGNMVYAVADGTIEKIYTDYPGSLAGNGVRLRMADGTYFFYAHLLATADGIDVGVAVTAGQIIGQIGNTGNSGTPHLHFEIHPQGGEAINPYPLVKAVDGCSITDPLPQP